MGQTAMGCGCEPSASLISQFVSLRTLTSATPTGGQEHCMGAWLRSMRCALEPYLRM